MALSLPHNITAGTLLDATQVEANFDALETGAVAKAGDTLTGTLTTQLLTPTTNSTYDLGTNTVRYRTLYVDSITGPAGSYAFGKIVVAGQTDVEAEQTADTLTLVAGSGITLTTSAGSDTVTISRSTAVNTAPVGSSAITASVGGTIYNYQHPTGEANVTTGEDTLKSITIAANVLANDGDAVEFYAAGSFASNANNKNLKVKYGATTLATSGVLGVGGNWVAEGRIVRTGAGAQVAAARLVVGSTAIAPALTLPAETLSGAVAFAVTGEGVDTGDISIKMLRLSYAPVAPQ